VTLLEHGALRPDAGWDLDRLPFDTGIPDSVRAVLAARIDLLPSVEKTALQAAAVIGRAFWPGAVRRLLGGADPDLRLLEQRDFIRRRSGSSIEGESEFVFKHAITREVSYNSLAIRDRVLLHAEFAAWLEERGGGRDEDASALALHYAEAARPENADLAWKDDPAPLGLLQTKAVAWLRRAADLAAGRCEVEEALALLDQALALAAEDGLKVEILREIARTHTFRYDAEGLRAALEQALALRPDPAVAGEIYAQLAFYGLGRPYMWKEPPSRELGDEWLANALELSKPGTEARAYALLARVFSDPRHAHKGEAYAISESLGNPRLVVLACEAQTLAAGERGQYAEACEWAERAIDVGSELDDPGLRAHEHWNASFVFLKAGRIGKVQPFVHTYDRLSSSLTAHDRVHAMALLVLLESVLGHWTELARLAKHAEAATTANEDFPCQFNWRNLLVCALGLAHAGAESEARRLEGLGRASAVVAGPAEREPALVRLALLRGDHAALSGILDQLPSTYVWDVDAAAARLDALVALGETERVEEEAAPHLDQESYTEPFALRALGVVHSDRALLERSASRFDAMGLAWRAEETRSLLTR
jgi:hypothetical protein